MKVGFTARVQSRCCSRSQNGRSSFGPYCRGFSPQAASASTSRELPRTATAARRPRTLSGGGMGIVSLKEGGRSEERRVGQEWGGTVRARCGTINQKKK